MKRTIASLALLRMNWDSYNRDYIEIFVPFIVTLINKKKYKTFTNDILRKDFENEYGLRIPYYPIITIFKRTTKRGYIKKLSATEYAPVHNLVEAEEFSENAMELERKYNNVLSEFISFCKDNYSVNISKEAADRILIAFLKDHDLDIIFATNKLETILPDVTTTEQEKFLINRFVQEIHSYEPQTFAFIVDISMGHILANAILYDIDLERFHGKIKSDCYLDAGIIFDILGVNEESRGEASKDLIKTLIKSGSKIHVFRHTFEEVLGILNSCIEWMRSSYFDPAKASRAAKYFKDHNYTSSEVESFILSIEDRIIREEIDIIQAPNPNDEKFRPYYFDEKVLYDKIVDAYKFHNPYFEETEKDFTLYQDVKSVSTVNILRMGNKPLSLPRVRHIFITTNATLAYASRQFEMEEGEERNLHKHFFFIPVAITDVFLGTLLWAQNPSQFAKINQKRLIANCYAALQPTKTLLRKYTVAAEKELEKGSISEEELILLKTSRIARNFLMDETLNDPDLFNETSIPEILLNIKRQLMEDNITVNQVVNEQLVPETNVKVDIPKSNNSETKKKSETEKKNEIDAGKGIAKERKWRNDAEKRAQEAEKKLEAEKDVRSRENFIYSFSLSILASIILIGIFEWLIYKIPWDWLIQHSNSYGLQGCIDFILLGLSFFVFVPKWRKTILIILIVPFVAVALQILGGPPKP